MWVRIWAVGGGGQPGGDYACIAADIWKWEMCSNALRSKAADFANKLGRVAIPFSYDIEYPAEMRFLQILL